MGPPINTWPYSLPPLERGKVTCYSKKCLVVNIVDNLRTVGINFTFALLLLQVFSSLSSVTAGPVILNLDYLQGPVPLARNIRHLPCISRSTSQEGLCMFAIDCLKANGTHLGTCIDRFYFGSCCQIQDKTTLPQIIGNNIDDNSIDNANFVHPLIDDKIQNHIFLNKDKNKPSVINNVTKKPAVESNEQTDKPATLQDRTEPEEPETKSDELTTQYNKITNDNVKTTNAMDTTTKGQPTTQSIKTTSQIMETTDIPAKLSTFQTVSGDVNNAVTNKSETLKPNKTETTETIKPTTERVTTEKPIRPTRKPAKPIVTYKPRPYRPTNFTKPPHISIKPRPTKPINPYNSTRKPPYRNPPKRPSTKKPLPSPPRLNITIIPQSTSTRPVFTRPSLSTITYINTTISQAEEIPVTTTTSTTETNLPPSPTTTTSTTTTTTTTTTAAPTTTPTTTERVVETTENIVTETVLSSLPTEAITDKLTEKYTTTVTSESQSETISTEPVREVYTEKDIQAPFTEKVTLQEEYTEKETVKPVTEADVPLTAKPTTTSTEYPPLVTWSNGIYPKPAETSTQAPDDVWSPITPPEGWVLISSMSPKPETTTVSQTTTTTTTAAPTSSEEPITVTEPPLPPISVITTQKLETPITTTESVVSSPSSISSASSATTQASILEFTVNVTLSPTMPTSTSSIGLLNVTLGSISDNATSASGNQTETTQSIGSTDTDVTTDEAVTTEQITTTTESYNMSNYKDVCGRRMWPQARIVGGAKSGFGQWPWQISLRQYRTSTYLHKCGAALLNENWAITAAHCVERVPPSELLVRLGEYDLANEEEPYGFAERRVQIVASHPHFDPATFEYDLALLRFYEPVTFQPNILPVCVPDDDDDYVGRTAYVTGWGRLYDEGPLPSVLQEVEVPVINNTACESMYLAAGYNEHIPNIFICAGWKKGGSDSCEGDSGGPMVVPRRRDGRFVLSGIISWGIGCAEPNQPGVYTRISEFRDWINQILQF
ncbi:serine protease filzig [Nymphalis io]|uniref:serine protease filzig n=1 Tax=Inachis io TaxID=171585 RepID=UPI002167767D|nr:serine protease filzig [Nymphalis io]